LQRRLLLLPNAEHLDIDQLWRMLELAVARADVEITTILCKRLTSHAYTLLLQSVADLAEQALHYHPPVAGTTAPPCTAAACMHP
jgi:hypothetical protein